MNRIMAVMACEVCAGVWVAHAGEIQGRVKIIEGLTKQRVSTPAYQSRGIFVAPGRSGSGVVDELSRVVVYLEVPLPAAVNPVTAELKQRNRRFEPEVVAVPVGSSVSFPNADPIFHNVFSLSKAKQLDLGHYPSGQSRTIRFDKPGVVELYCHLHPNMNAVVLVLPGAFYTRPGADGTFQVAGVPAGHYKIVAWHKSAGLLRRSIQVPENGVVHIDFEIPAVDADAVR